MTTPIDPHIHELYATATLNLLKSHTAFVNEENKEARQWLDSLSDNITNLRREWDRFFVEQDEKDSTSGFLKLQLAGLQSWLSKETDPIRRCVVASRIEEVKQELARTETL